MADSQWPTIDEWRNAEPLRSPLEERIEWARQAAEARAREVAPFIELGRLLAERCHYIDVGGWYDGEEWAEVVADVIVVLRDNGWTVTGP
jgi:hypothetical protein